MEPEKKIILTSGKQKHLVRVNEIVFIKASNIYSHVYLSNGNVIVASETISQLEKIIHASHFYRTHRSFIVNLDYADIYKRVTLKLTMKNRNELIPIARDKKKDFETLFNNLFFVL